MSEELAGEPIPGLPQRPPAGEKILWQGAPQWRATALRTFHVRKVAVYFVALFAWGVLDGLIDREPLAGAALTAAKVIPVAVLVIGLLVALSVLVARTTVYTVTSQRVVMRFGLALPMAVNLPFRLVAGASVKAWPDGTGNIPLQLRNGARVGYVVMWPNVRPWHVARPQPMLRGVADVQKVATVLAAALLEAEPALATQPAAARTLAEGRADASDPPATAAA